jgi:hypothetical protein
VIFILEYQFIERPADRPVIACLIFLIFVIIIALIKKKKNRSQVVAPATTAQITIEDPQLAQKTGFPAEVLEIARKESKGILEQFHYRVEDRRDKAYPGLELAVAPQNTRNAVSDLRAQLGHLGYLIFVCEYGYAYKPNKICILKLEDQYEILRLLKVDGVNYDIDTDALIAKLSQWDKLYGLHIYGADMNTVEVDFDNLPDDLDSFAKEICEFCPDCEDPQEISRELKKSETLFLWWD